jgi:hypothetical protein
MNYEEKRQTNQKKKVCYCTNLIELENDNDGSSITIRSECVKCGRIIIEEYMLMSTTKYDAGDTGWKNDK